MHHLFEFYICQTYMYIFYKIIQLKFKFSGTIDRKTWHALKARASQETRTICTRTPEGLIELYLEF
jgi:hypothetical protein